MFGGAPGRDPVESFGRWYAAAGKRRDITLPEAVCLSTSDADGWPDGRMVLLKGFDEEGFTFYTNLDSPKAKALAANPRAALTFHWPPLGRQVRLRGRVAAVATREADEYFASRPRLSQLGAWASRQSAPLESRTALMAEVAKLALKWPRKVPRPANWSGYRLVPDRVEFWQHRAYRLHDRFLYTRQAGGAWKVQRLYP